MMSTNLIQLKKLRGRSFRELRERSQQELAKLGQRWRGLREAEMSDAALLRQIVPASRNGSGIDAAGLILARLRACASPFPYGRGRWAFLPALTHREEIVETMQNRFAAESEAIIKRAERACAGRFDLLGHRGLSFETESEAIDWRLDPLSGKRATFAHWSALDPIDPLGGGDVKVTWELNRHSHFVTLGQAYWLTNDERFVASFIAQALSWMDANPPGMGVNWMSSLEAAFRAIAWIWALHLCAGSPLMTADFISRSLKQLIAHGRHIESFLSRYFSPNTHLTGEALGLIYLGSAFPELQRAKSWRETGLNILLEQAPLQLRPDGVYFEQSSYYHRYTADFYTHLRILEQERYAQLPREEKERLVRAFDHLMWITRPDGRSSLIGDDDGGRLIKLGERAANDFRDTLATAAALHARGDWKWVAGSATSETLWILGPKGLADYDNLPAAPPRKLVMAFKDSGYFVMRDGWEPESSYVLFDCGPHGAPVGAGHAHADALSFEFAACSVMWLVDPGTYIYAADPHTRDEFRTTAAHNTVVVDGEPQSLPGGPFSWRTAADGRIATLRAGDRGAYVEGSHDGYHRLNDPVTHQRTVLLVNADRKQGLPAYLVVRDVFIARDHHRYTFYYHFYVTCHAAAVGDQIRVIGPGGAALTLATFGTAESRASVTQEWTSQCYGQRARAAVGVFEADGVGKQEFVTVIIPGPPEHIARVEGRIITDWRTREVKPWSKF